MPPQPTAIFKKVTPMILTPEYIFKTIECIHPDFLAAHGIKALVLDVDNTLTGDNSQVLEPSV